MSIQIIGQGRAGLSLFDALGSLGWDTPAVLGRGDSLLTLPSVDVIALAVPDNAIASVARSLPPTSTPIIHLSGSRSLADLEPHFNVGSLHPLVSLPNRSVGAARLLDNCFFAVAGHPITVDIARSLGGRFAVVNDERRSVYHAAATVAANHSVALAAQVEALAVTAGIDPDPLYELMITTIENVRALGPAAALTGPASRGDWDTIRGHLKAIGPEHEAFYRAALSETIRLTDLTPPEDLA